MKGCLAIVALYTGFFTIVPFVMSGGLKEFFFPYNEEQLKMALADARVTEVSESRRQYTYYLDDDDTEDYSFNSYVHAEPALRKDMNDTLGYDTSDLGHYLRLGDRLTKAANSPLVTVRRGSFVTHWILYSATPEGQRPTPKRPFITHVDSPPAP